MSSDPDGFTYAGNVMHAGGLPLPMLAEAYGTPLYVYDAAIIRRQITALRDAFEGILPPDRQPLIAYACKANTNGSILGLMAGMGLGADVVSAGEMERAIRSGIPADKIVFSGVGKTQDELVMAIEREILQINIESAAELDRLIDLNPPYKVRVAFRLNPDVAADTHAKISTGHGTSKFGMPADAVATLYDRARESKNIIPAGISLHIGSQITTLDPFEEAFKKLGALAKDLKADTIDFGGGIAIPYNNELQPDLLEYAGLVNKYLSPVSETLITEPGRFLVAQAGVVLSRVVHVKDTPSRPIVILDAGMNDLVRPAMYDAVHRILPVDTSAIAKSTVDIVGPICESSDIFASDVTINAVKHGDLVAIMDCGAFGFSMASPYNSRPLPAEVMVDAGKHALIRRRQTTDDLIREECTPEWQVVTDTGGPRLRGSGAA